MDPARNPETQQFGIANNINMLNVYEVADMIRMWKGYPVKEMNFSHTHTKFTDPSAEIRKHVVNSNNASNFRNATKLIEEVAKEVDFPVCIYNPLEMNFK